MARCLEAQAGLRGWGQPRYPKVPGLMAGPVGRAGVRGECKVPVLVLLWRQGLAALDPSYKDAAS